MHQIRMVWMMWSPFLSTQAVKGTTLWPAWTFRVVATSLCGSSVVLLSSWRAHRQTGAISLTFVNVFIYLCLYLLWLKLERLYAMLLELQTNDSWFWKKLFLVKVVIFILIWKLCFWNVCQSVHFLCDQTRCDYISLYFMKCVINCDNVKCT